mgnify:CR=1 FL=1
MEVGPRRMLLFVLGLSVGLLLGCAESLPETIPVTGTVTFADEPLTSGDVTFHPHVVAEGLPRRPARGSLDATGAFQLSTFRSGDGAVPGTYRVTIHSYSNRPDKFDDSGTFTPQWRIPQRYGDPRTSGLTVEVSPDEMTGNVTLKLSE